jgi:hypothetical protein
MERGQVTIEMIFIFGLFMLLIFSVSVPSVFKVERDAWDVQLVSDAKFATDRLATLAGSISHPDEKKNAEIYIPGYTTDFGSAPPLTLMVTCIEAEGSSLNTSLAIMRWDSECKVVTESDADFSKNLGSGDWKIYVNTGSGYQEGALLEINGAEYDLTISWENITSHTVPSYVANDCDDAEVILTAVITGLLSGGACP